MEQILILLIIICGFVYLFSKKKKTKSSEENPLSNEGKPEKTKVDIDVTNKYRQKYLMTINERNEYYKIKKVCNSLNLNLFTKVRLLDFIEPVPGIKNWKTYLYKIQAKHVDFLICKENMSIVCAIEIDDNSHKKQDRIERDDLVNTIFVNVKVPLIRAYSINEVELEKQLKSLIYKNSYASIT